MTQHNSGLCAVYIVYLKTGYSLIYTGTGTAIEKSANYTLTEPVIALLFIQSDANAFQSR